MSKTILLLVLILTVAIVLCVFASYLIGQHWNMAEWFSFFFTCIMV